MIEPVAVGEIMRAVIAGALVVMAGACYAFFFALAQLRGRQFSLLATAYGGYVVLVISVLVLADALNLHGYWQIVVATMLIGYLLAPHWIWRLCVGTHAGTHGDESSDDDSLSSKPDREIPHG